MESRVIDPKTLADLERQNGLPSGLLTAVMQAESGGNPNAVSKAGALGLFQFMPKTAEAYGIDPLDPMQAAEGAARMYGDLNKQYEGDLPKMLAAYNWGSGNLSQKGLENAPKETRDYIAKIQAALPKQYADAGNIAMDAQVDGLPEGFVLDNQAASLPEGFVLDAE
jgi:soluble lytic murein transglycosylase-like protein